MRCSIPSPASASALLAALALWTAPALASAETIPAKAQVPATAPPAGAGSPPGSPAPGAAPAPAPPPAPPPAPTQAPAPAPPPPPVEPAPPADAPIASKEQQARAEFEQGQRQYDLGRFERAISHYARAYEALPLPGFLFNIAQSHRHLAQPRQAAFFYRRYLDLEQSPPNAALAKALLAEMDAAQGILPPPAPDAEAAASGASPDDLLPLYRRRWVWYAAAGLVAVTATAATVAATRPDPPTLGTVSAR